MAQTAFGLDVLARLIRLGIVSESSNKSPAVVRNGTPASNFKPTL